MPSTLSINPHIHLHPFYYASFFPSKEQGILDQIKAVDFGEGVVDTLRFSTEPVDSFFCRFLRYAALSILAVDVLIFPLYPV